MVEKDVFVRFTGSPFYTRMLANDFEENLRKGGSVKGEGWVNDAKYDFVKVDGNPFILHCVVFCTLPERH
jgi:hypothetical protein